MLVASNLPPRANVVVLQRRVHEVKRLRAVLILKVVAHFARAFIVAVRAVAARERRVAVTASEGAHRLQTFAHGADKSSLDAELGDDKLEHRRGDLI